jgi:FtsP/CotA-like multicopper oxidase with cupredoxin domain
MSDGDGLHVDFSCNVTHVGSIETPHFVTDAMAAQLIAEGKITGLRKFLRKFFNEKFRMPDGTEVEFWAFEDETSGRHLPSPQIRVKERELAQVTLKPSKKVHTIHHHGIEPDPFNDGVGHTSFEVSGEYTYQWRAVEAGSYWYHCHVNTVLHVQMGMFGTLVVDPYPETNPKRVFRDGPEYVHERYWVPYSVDPRWHELGHAAGLCGEDVGLNNFQPKYFGISGAFQQDGHDPAAARQAPPIADENVAVTAPSGEPILIRILNGQYFPIEVLFGSPQAPLEVEPVASDARPYLDSTDYSGLRGNATPLAQFRTASLPGITPAERYDVILNTPDRPVAPGDYTVTISFLHWIFGDERGVARTTIKIT